VYCGYDKNNLNLCYITPFKVKTRRPLGWSNKYFQGKREGYQDSIIIKHPVAYNRVAWVKFNLIKDALKVKKHQ